MTVETVLAIVATAFVFENAAIAVLYLAYRRGIPRLHEVDEIVRKPFFKTKFGKSKHKPFAISDEQAFMLEQDQ